ncbi:hypothetical protein EDB86DRAFT_1533529 [Lactarius hatsudake]|nr:hypothetical protein EDB86DRAFT_1533529 [Lactarius hatsudake]
MGKLRVSPRRTPTHLSARLVTPTHRLALTIVVQFSCSIEGKPKFPILSTSSAASLPHYLLKIASDESLSLHKHMFGQPPKKERGVDIDNLKVTRSAWDTNVVSTSTIAANWNSFCGGVFTIFPALPPFGGPQGIPSELPDIIPLAWSHTALALGTDWSPRSNSIVAFGDEYSNMLAGDGYWGYLTDTTNNSGEFPTLSFTILTFT